MLLSFIILGVTVLMLGWIAAVVVGASELRSGRTKKAQNRVTQEMSRQLPPAIDIADDW